MQFATMKLTIYLPKMTIFNTVIPILMHYFTFFPFKMFICVPKSSGVSDVKPDISQWKVTLHNDVRFLTVYCRIFRHKLLTKIFRVRATGYHCRHI